MICENVEPFVEEIGEALRRLTIWAELNQTKSVSNGLTEAETIAGRCQRLRFIFKS